MLIQSDLVFTQENMNKPDMELHKVCAFVIEEDVVEVGIYKNDFYDLVLNSNISESEVYENLDSRLSFVNKETEEVVDVRLNEMLSSILLSGSLMIQVTSDTPWVVVGTKYINHEFVR